MLDELANALYNWYNFKNGSEALIIGPALDLESFFRERRIKAVLYREEDKAQYKGIFDYVIATQVIENAQDPEVALAEWGAYLKSTGTLLFTCDNRYGLKYFCGTQDPYTGISFDGVNGYLKGSSKGRLYSKSELESYLENTGMQYKFYYPVPDSRMPQMIFTDSYCNGINAAERLIDYNYRDPSMIGVEHRMMAEMINCGGLAFCSNSFLVEATASELSGIIYAVSTPDRGEVRGCATTICDDGYVYKRALYLAGEDNLRKLVENTNYLLEKDVPVVPLELVEDEFGLAIKMRRIEAPGLTSVLDEIAESRKNEFYTIFDSFFAYIKAASDKEIYLDIAPCNSFYLGEGKILLYDQEFTLTNCSVQFAMYRTIKYCYASDRKLEGFIPKEELLRRYGIDSSSVDEYELLEKRFINSIRNKDEYACIYDWATPDYDFIYGRMIKVSELLGEPKKPYKVGYVPGVYDLFHKGHLRLFERCKERCEHLIVGVLTDELVEYYKGKKPVISYENRAAVIRGLKCVDEVVPVDFSNTDKLDAWEQLHYDCHFSGDDHINHWNDVGEELKKRGSNMEFFTYTDGISSTEIKQKMKN